MDENKIWFYRTVGNNVVKALEENEFRAAYFDTPALAVDAILKEIPENAIIGIGGSVTIREIGLEKLLMERNHLLYTNWGKKLSQEEKIAIRKGHLNCDVFLTSTNAITLTGCLVNIDGVGNRVAAMIYGPKKVIVVAGINKVTEDVESAIKRVRNIAAPRNAKRLGLDLPCAITGFCNDCKSKTRICRALVILEKKPRLTDYFIAIIGAELGF